ncbi:uncharacterized protein CCOS01_02155 [Colletotrichum costaricense]|uniref:C2H2-type domain-containing protein n=1 Tax=Colletotrichum costaricense TaxID=1209916 RepID=A0AAI9Z7F0_9PEZI|nr:uncharacterized protein CCOS01_02155 [Colletotrichum costaricense]KAK1536835.1 hypothetical protein CCOS01_02155 [Colletotrichum costaricense]
MPTKNNTSKPSIFQCEQPECRGKRFNDQSNFNRHQKSVHGDKVPMPCGSLITDRPDNIQRHQDKCGECQQSSGIPSSSVGNGTGPEIAFNVSIPGAEPQYTGMSQISYQQLWMQRFHDGHQHGYRDGSQAGWQHGQYAYQSGYTYGHHYLPQSQQQTTQSLNGLQQNYQDGYQTGYPQGYHDGYHDGYHAGYYQSH